MGVRTGRATLIFFVVFLIIAVFLPGRGSGGNVITLISVSTFLFGIFGATVMRNRHLRLNNLRHYLRLVDGHYVSLYMLIDVYGEKTRKKVLELIDNTITRTVDYRLQDYYKATPEFHKLFSYIVHLKPATPVQGRAYDRLAMTCTNLSNHWKCIEYLVRNRMMGFMWLVLYGLLAIILFSIHYLNDGSFPSVVISVILSTSAIMFMLILRDLNTLEWKEQRWIWDPLEGLFKELGLLPYYPKEAVDSGRIIIPKGSTYRLSDIAYPDMSTKKVTVVQS